MEVSTPHPHPLHVFSFQQKPIETRMSSIKCTNMGLFIGYLLP